MSDPQFLRGTRTTAASPWHGCSPLAGTRGQPSTSSQALAPVLVLHMCMQGEGRLKPVAHSKLRKGVESGCSFLVFDCQGTREAATAPLGTGTGHLTDIADTSGRPQASTTVYDSTRT